MTVDNVLLFLGAKPTDELLVRWRAAMGLGRILRVGVALWLLIGGGEALAAKPAPEISGGKWINEAPLTLQSLRGKVVLVDFWTYS
ncbi:MAG: hypothetical protein V3T23_00925 [Nitrososphaerales archaeon]